ncbi:NADPH-dependent FMN reductase [Catalinimonas niigatensis]|uniref:NADPH-dependent FMN reductase n=1 Tax=Catalinimonas niigatensis TaxID=1397264 RepID=UPI00266549D1|nr:NADPH-dependent FMN reductase [Catalinimonas niigatensis]WPP49509.1 NADPH-dependent FMN reductase [Catalinimonas niigatensis]
MKKEKLKVFAISGSTKQYSSNESILKYISINFQDHLEVDIYEGIERLPHFNPDHDNENVDETVKDFRRRIFQADAVIICTPEYVFSLPGSLKNAIEWNVSTTNFSNKPVAFIVAAASGEKAFEALDLIMTTIESRIAKGAKLLIKGVKGKVSANGIIHDSRTEDSIRKLVISLIQSVEEENPLPNKYLVRQRN